MKKTIFLYFFIVSLTISSLVFALAESPGQFYQATGTGAMNVSLTPGHTAEIKQIQIHRSGTFSTESLDLWIDSHSGSAYDTKMRLDMPMQPDTWWPAAWDQNFQSKNIWLTNTDVLRVQWPNANGNTCGITIVYSTYE